MTTAPLILSLNCGGAVAVSEYGTKDGRAGFFCHGWPSSRTMAELTDSRRARIEFAHHFTRWPGIATPRFNPKENFSIGRRSSRNWPTKWGLMNFAFSAFPVARPYAFAAAWAMPERVRAIAVVSGAPPLRVGRSRGFARRFIAGCFLFLSSSSRAFALLVSRRPPFLSLEGSASVSPAPSQTPPTLRRQCHARHRRLRGLL